MIVGGGVKIQNKRKKSDGMSMNGVPPMVLGEHDFVCPLNHPIM